MIGQQKNRILYHERCAAIHGVAKRQTGLSDWTELTENYNLTEKPALIF